MLAALVELQVDLRGFRARKKARTADYVRSGVERQSEERKHQVIAALKQARALGCELILFPGWTIVAEALPKEFYTLSKGRTVVLERLEPGASSHKGSGGYRWWTYVLQDGLEAVSAQQVLSSSAELKNPGQVDTLAKQLDSVSSRKWRLGSAKDALLLVCGEVNIVKGGGRSRTGLHVFKNVVSEQALRGGGVILNPAHTPNRLPSMNDKREWLSRRGGWLLSTANIFSKPPHGTAAKKSAQAWHNGAAVHLDDAEPGSGFMIKTVEVL